MFPDTLNNTIWTLRNALKKNRVPIWKAVIKELSRSRSNRREVNIGQLAHVTKDKEVVISTREDIGIWGNKSQANNMVFQYFGSSYKKDN